VLRSIVENASGLELVGLGRSGEEGLKLIAELDPDVVTLDIDMPGMDGLDVLSQIMAERPRAVVMLSYLTQHGGEASMRALRLGAVDVVGKPSGAISLNLADVGDELVEKIRVAARATARKTGEDLGSAGATGNLGSSKRSASKNCGYWLLNGRTASLRSGGAGSTAPARCRLPAGPAHASLADPLAGRPTGPAAPWPDGA